MIRQVLAPFSRSQLQMARSRSHGVVSIRIASEPSSPSHLTFSLHAKSVTFATHHVRPLVFLLDPLSNVLHLPVPGSSGASRRCVLGEAPIPDGLTGQTCCLPGCVSGPWPFGSFCRARPSEWFAKCFVPEI